MRSRRSSSARGFSLIEILVVMALAGLLGALALPAFNRISAASNLSAGGRSLADQLHLARQTAIARNARVEFRLYQLPDDGAPGGDASPKVYRACQAFVLDADGAAQEPVSRPVLLPRGVAFLSSSSASSLLPDAPSNPPSFNSGEEAGGGARFVGYPPSSYNYMAFRFNPDGGTDLDPKGNWYISLALRNDAPGANGVPANFVTIQVYPLNGRTRYFQP